MIPCMDSPFAAITYMSLPKEGNLSKVTTMLVCIYIDGALEVLELASMQGRESYLVRTTTKVYTDCSNNVYVYAVGNVCQSRAAMNL